MTALSQMIAPERICLNLRAVRKAAAIEELVNLLAAGGGISDPDRLTREVLEREELSSTGVGAGIALPHRLSDTVQRSTVVFGRSVKGVPFGAVDRKPAHLIFLLVGPANGHMEHLKLLSRLSRLLHNPEFRARLMAAATADEVAGPFREQETG